MAQPCADPRAIALAPRSAAISEGTLVDVPTAAGPACPLSFAPQQSTALAPRRPSPVRSSGTQRARGRRLRRRGTARRASSLAHSEQEDEARAEGRLHHHRAVDLEALRAGGEIEAEPRGTDAHGDEREAREGDIAGAGVLVAGQVLPRIAVARLRACLEHHLAVGERGDEAEPAADARDAVAAAADGYVAAARVEMQPRGVRAELPARAGANHGSDARPGERQGEHAAAAEPERGR